MRVSEKEYRALLHRQHGAMATRMPLVAFSCHNPLTDMSALSESNQGHPGGHGAQRKILALDPGPAHTGYAVLCVPGSILTSGTLIPRGLLSVLDRHLWLLSRLQDLLATWTPQVLAYEDFVWRLTENGGHPTRGRSAMERLIGGIQALALSPPYPVLMPLLPQAWGRQLLGDARHSKQQIAWAVNARLGTAYTGSIYDNHETDAVGLGLVALDTVQDAAYLRQYRR